MPFWVFVVYLSSYEVMKTNIYLYFELVDLTATKRKPSYLTLRLVSIQGKNAATITEEILVDLISGF